MQYIQQKPERYESLRLPLLLCSLRKGGRSGKLGCYSRDYINFESWKKFYKLLFSCSDFNYKPVTALNQFPTNESGPPLATMPPMKQANPQRPIAADTIPIVYTPALETSDVAETFSPVRTCVRVFTVAFFISLPPEILLYICLV